jgi:hypothetical protein
MRLAKAWFIVAMLAGSAHADGDALEDMLGPREIAVGEALRGGATGASAVALNPAGLPLARELVFEGGYGYRGSDQASLVDVSACDSTAALPGCFYYDYAGESPELGGMSLHRTTHLVGSALAYPLTPHVFLGAALKYFHFSSDVPGETSPSCGSCSDSGFNWDLGTTVRITDVVNLGVTGYNLMGAESPQFPRAVGGGVLARPLPNLALSFDSRWRLDGMQNKARYGGGAELFVRTANGQTGFPIRAGALRDGDLRTTYLSAGLGLASMKYGIDIAGRTAVSGISETMIIASMRFFGPRMRPPGFDPAEE